MELNLLAKLHLEIELLHLDQLNFLGLQGLSLNLGLFAIPSKSTM